MLDRFRTIKAVQPEQELHLRIEYDDGQIIIVDFEPVIRQGGVFAPLADEQLFAQAKPGPRGRSVCWPGDIDFCADALRLEAQQENCRHAR